MLYTTTNHAAKRESRFQKQINDGILITVGTLKISYRHIAMRLSLCCGFDLKKVKNMQKEGRTSQTLLRGYPDLLTVKDVQEVLQIGRSTAYKLLQSGEIRAIKIRTLYRIPKRNLVEYLST
jgi:excisionase family DNA binding protein